MRKSKPHLDANLSKVKIEPYLMIESGKRYISIQETQPRILVRIALNTKTEIRFVDLDTEEDFDKLWNKLMEISQPCH